LPVLYVVTAGKLKLTDPERINLNLIIKHLFMKQLPFLLFTIVIAGFSNCKKHNPPNDKKYPADVANTWMQMHMQLTKTTAGYNSVVSQRSFGYAGVTLYAALFPAISNGGSFMPQIGGTDVIADKDRKEYFWPASANAAMAMITREFFESTSPANKFSIDSLEASFNAKFRNEASEKKIQNGIDYGHKVAAAIFGWSKTDGGHEAYKHVVDPSYIPPAGPGLWIPTPPAFAPPVHPHWGANRSFTPNSAALSQPDPPLAYSESDKSSFYAMVNELYTISLSLSHEDTIIAKFWGDIPGNLNVPAHATNIVTQLINAEKMNLYEAAAVYAMHGIALYDAGISVLKTKYTYNLLRPVSYIRNVLQKPLWNTVIPTPAHPEYTAAHAVVSAASATVLEGIFGKNYKFSDHTYDAVYGTRTFNSFEDYAKEAGRSRVLAGIHYSPSIAAGLIQGRKVGDMVNKLKLKK
jgi:PAP2 superfamily